MEIIYFKDEFFITNPKVEVERDFYAFSINSFNFGPK